MTEICKVCGKPYKQITTMHVRTHGMSLAEYEAFDPSAPKRNIAPKGDTEITPEEIEKGIWGEQERDTGRPLSEFLKEFDITEKELREIARRFKSGKPIDVKTDAANKQKIGEKGALELKDEIGEIEVFCGETAEILKVKYGFKEITSKGGPPRSWILKKD